MLSKKEGIMGREGIIMMSSEELRRISVVNKAIGRLMSQKKAAEVIGVSERQVRRLIKRVKEEGDPGIIHKSRGKSGNRKIDNKVRGKVIEFYKEKYWGFGPTFGSEKLYEIDGIRINRETLRLWLVGEDRWDWQRRGRKHRQWRERKEYLGEMVQMDGSHHDWLEGRGPELVLMGYIDDATNTVFTRFYEYEGTLPAMDSFRAYIECYGIPQSVYLDKHTTYKSTRKLTIEEELEGLREPKSQFERALDGLGVEVIHANSPQAKGRIERLFGTFQDRLIKEMRLAGISTKEEANRFLERYLPIHNQRFSITPAKEVNLHREIPKGIELDRIFSVRTKRALRKDFTIVHNKELYQIEDTLPNTRGKSVMVEERIDGTMHVTDNGFNLKYKKIEVKPLKPKEQKPLKPRKTYIPPPDHPWRRFRISSYRYQQRERKLPLANAK